MLEADAIEAERKMKRVQGDGADKNDGEPRDEGSILSIRSKMRLAAYFRVARRACFGVALMVGGFVTFVANVLPLP